MIHKGLPLFFASCVLSATGAVGALGQSQVGPGPAEVDAFHPSKLAKEAQPKPAYGGRVVVHLESMPANINRAIENSAVTRNMHHNVHESLVAQDWESWQYVPNLAASWDTEDLVALKPDAASKYATRPNADGTTAIASKVKVRIPRAELDRLPAGSPEQREVTAVFGRVEEVDGGYRVSSGSANNPLGAEPLFVAKDDVLQIELGSVFTFHLREDVYWHPTEGFEKHRFDARDVYFSWSVFNNPHVECDEVRFQFVKITRGDLLDANTVRFFYESQYFAALGSVGVDMMMLPSHLYDLSDPDNRKFDAATAPGGRGHDAEVFAKAQGQWINETDYNSSKFVGLGPYRISDYTQQKITAERFWDYFDPARAGYFDSIQWFMIDNDDAAFQALLNREIQYMDRVSSANYSGEATEKAVFTDHFYKGYFYLGNYGFTAWNMTRPELADVEVRRALAMAFDGDEYLTTQYRGLANRITGPFPYNSLAYDHSVKPLPYDPDAATLVLEDAGWYDRNGNGVADKDGVELEIEFLMPSGNQASKILGTKMQESFRAIGVRLEIRELEWATFIERMTKRDFDGGNLAWMPDLESDPEQIWHGRWARPESASSNFSGFDDPQVNLLIEQGQRELDRAKRVEIWRAIHRRVYELMPYHFGYNVPRKFALDKNIRGFQSFAMRPGYSIRRWYYPEGTPGTRPTLKAEAPR
jgi:peptide/nickel transport system substrate-binding protein